LFLIRGTYIIFFGDRGKRIFFSARGVSPKRLELLGPIISLFI